MRKFSTTMLERAIKPAQNNFLIVCFIPVLRQVEKPFDAHKVKQGIDSPLH